MNKETVKVDNTIRKCLKLLGINKSITNISVIKEINDACNWNPEFYHILLQNDKKYGLTYEELGQWNSYIIEYADFSKNFKICDEETSKKYNVIPKFIWDYIHGDNYELTLSDLIEADIINRKEIITTINKASVKIKIKLTNGKILETKIYLAPEDDFDISGDNITIYDFKINEYAIWDNPYDNSKNRIKIKYKNYGYLNLYIGNYEGVKLR